MDFARQTDKMSPVEIVNLLNSIYLIFDEIVDIHGVYKVETIGESYMISAGVPYRFSQQIIHSCSHIEMNLIQLLLPIVVCT